MLLCRSGQARRLCGDGDSRQDGEKQQRRTDVSPRPIVDWWTHYRTLSADRFHNHTPLRAAVHLHDHRDVEPQAAHERRLFDGRLFGQPVPVDEALPNFRIHGEVAGVRRREVLKEMRPLRRRHAKVLEPGLDDRPRTGNLIP